MTHPLAEKRLVFYVHNPIVPPNKIQHTNRRNCCEMINALLAKAKDQLAKLERVSLYLKGALLLPLILISVITTECWIRVKLFIFMRVHSSSRL